MLWNLSLRLLLPIYSRTMVIDRYSVFTALEEDVYKLGVMSKFYYWNENDFCQGALGQNFEFFVKNRIFLLQNIFYIGFFGSNSKSAPQN